MSVTTRPTVGERVELGRYQISSGERVLYGQRVNGVVRLTDNPHPAGAPTSSSAALKRTATPRSSADR